MYANDDIFRCQRTLTYANVSERLHWLKTMLIRTPKELGAIIRDKRKRLGLGQSDLANRIGVSRQWVIEIEHGHPRAELGLVLRALDALDIRFDASTEPAKSGSAAKSAVNINAILAKAKKSKP
jgi:y4mF family transcriptional regulator